MDIPVISYNMSVFSAKGEMPTFASEYSFLVGRAVKHESGSFDFFINALKHLASQVEKINAKVIGIQEYEIKKSSIKDLIMNTLKEKNTNFKCHEFSKEIKNDAAVLTIWDESVLGERDSYYDADLGLTKEGGNLVTGLLPNDEGRPISIIKTKKGYVLINFHGINRPKYNPDGDEIGKDNSDLLKKLIQIRVEEAKATIGEIDPNKTIMMCDSNDREHKFNRETPLIIEGAQFSDGRDANDKSAISCCYNWDSVGIPKSKGKISLERDGAESNYKYTGDYVLAVNFTKSVTAVPSPQDDLGASIASDHKLVYAVVSVSAAGGRRRKTRRRIHRLKRKAQTKKQGKRQKKYSK